MRKLILCLAFLAASPAWSQQLETPISDCYSRAEGSYMFMSERIISLYQAASIDRFEFEKTRTQIIHQREADLLQCSARENKQLSAQIEALKSVNLEALAAPRMPASTSSIYEEVQPINDISE